MPLFRDVQPGDRLTIGDTVIEVESKTGQRTRLRIDSPQEVVHDKAGARPQFAAPPIPTPRPSAPAEPTGAPRPRLQLPAAVLA